MNDQIIHDVLMDLKEFLEKEDFSVTSFRQGVLSEHVNTLAIFYHKRLMGYIKLLDHVVSFDTLLSEIQIATLADPEYKEKIREFLLDFINTHCFQVSEIIQENE